MRPLRSCREVTALVLQGQDRTLSRWERLSMHVHWWVCGSCRHFRGQAALMQQAMVSWRHYRDQGEGEGNIDGGPVAAEPGRAQGGPAAGDTPTDSGAKPPPAPR